MWLSKVYWQYLKSHKMIYFTLHCSMSRIWMSEIYLHKPYFPSIWSPPLCSIHSKEHKRYKRSLSSRNLHSNRSVTVSEPSCRGFIIRVIFKIPPGAIFLWFCKNIITVSTNYMQGPILCLHSLPLMLPETLALYVHFAWSLL